MATHEASRTRALAAVLSTAALVAALSVTAALGFDPGVEARNFSKTHERSREEFLKPEYQAMLAQRFQDNIAEEDEIRNNDPERDYSGNICGHRSQECAGDVRFYGWEQKGYGLMKPVLWTGRSGAVISGAVWATRAGPAKRPGIVITTGSVQAPETMYWGIAATLAKKGYVVLTYDVQGQGRSDTFGEGVDSSEGVPSQEGRPFFDGTEDALDFLLSTPDQPFEPRPSCSTGTSHAPKHERRVEEGFNAPYNPLWELVDPERIGIAGHSLGAAAVSYIGQQDPRVDAIVAWDNLSAPGQSRFGIPDCLSGSSDRSVPPITKPALGMSNDYGLVPTPNSSDPDPEKANAGFAAYKDAGVDSMQVNVRGGTHFEYSYIPQVDFDATLRGLDMAIWYTAAWFDKYVKGDPTADDRLLTDRWHDDPVGKQIDPNSPPDGNLFSFYLRSRFDLAAAPGKRGAGPKAVCDDMRAGCASMGPDSCAPGSYSYLAEALTPDGTATEPQPCAGTGLRRCELVRKGGGGRDKLRGTSGGDKLRGKAGPDVLRGRGGRDCLGGGKGADRVDGGRDADKLSGGGGSDRIDARDGSTDKVRCGNGADRARVDGKDKLRGCESVKR